MRGSRKSSKNKSSNCLICAYLFFLHPDSPIQQMVTWVCQPVVTTLTAVPSLVPETPPGYQPHSGLRHRRIRTDSCRHSESPRAGYVPLSSPESLRTVRHFQDSEDSVPLHRLSLVLHIWKQKGIQNLYKYQKQQKLDFHRDSLYVYNRDCLYTDKQSMQ